MGCKVSSLQRVLAVLLLMIVSVLAWSMLAGTFPETKLTQCDSPARKLIAEIAKLLELMAQERRSSSFNEELDLNYVSRRRIPTGPDPIHNRRFVRLRVMPARH